MRRRNSILGLLAGLVSAAAISGAQPVAWAQQPDVPVVGFLGLTSPEAFQREVAAFQRGLGEVGYVEKRNVAIDYRWAGGHFEQLPALAKELVSRSVAVIAAAGTPAAGLAAKSATTTIPIVFASGADPVQIGLVGSLNRPGGNVTGIYMLTSALETKRLELLHELVPGASVIAVLMDPNSPDTAIQLKELSAAAQSIGQRITVFKVGNGADIDAAFAGIAEQRIGALLVASAPAFLPLRQQIAGLAERYRVPTVYFFRDFAAAGGLMSYGTSLDDAYRQVGVYTGKILKGAKPADLPVQQSVKVELVINLKTANTLGLTFPISLQGRADEVIE